MKRVLVLLTSAVGVVLAARRRKARDSSDLWAEATRALQAAPVAGSGAGGVEGHQPAVPPVAGSVPDPPPAP